MTNKPWPMQALSHVVEPVAKVDPTALARPTFRYVDIGSVDGEKHLVVQPATIPAGRAPGRARKLLREGDTVFSTVRPYLEKIARIDESLDGEIASTGFCVLRPHSDLLDSRYLFHYMTSRRLMDQVLPLQRGVSYPAVRDREVLACQIPLPPLDEQRRIVEILEDHLSRLDAADIALKRSLARAEKLIAAGAARCVAEASARPDTRRESMSHIARIGSGATPRRGTADYWKDGSIPWVTSGELAPGVITGTRELITPRALSDTAVKLWPIGTLLVAMYGEGKTRGTVGELGIEATSNQACAAIVLDENTPEMRAWLRLVLETRYDEMRRQASGGVQPNLSLGYFRDMVVPIPPASVRIESVTSQHLLADEATALSRAVTEAGRRSSSLRRALLAAAFSGRFTGRSSDLDVAGEMVGA